MTGISGRGVPKGAQNGYFNEAEPSHYFTLPTKPEELRSVKKADFEGIVSKKYVISELRRYPEEVEARRVRHASPGMRSALPLVQLGNIEFWPIPGE